MNAFITPEAYSIYISVQAQKTVAEDCQGACTAAKKLWVHAEPVCRGWELATPEIVNETTER